MASTSKFLLEIFDGEGNYTIWRMKMKSILIELEDYNVVTKEYPADSMAKEVAKMDNTVMATLITHLDGRVIHV